MCVCVHMGVSALFKLFMWDGLYSNEEFTKGLFGVKKLPKWCRHFCSVVVNCGVSFRSHHSVQLSWFVVILNKERGVSGCVRSLIR